MSVLSAFDSCLTARVHQHGIARVQLHLNMMRRLRAVPAVTSPEQFTVNLRGPKENLSKAVEELEHELSSCVKTEQMPLRKVPKSVKKSLKEVAAKHDVNITFSSKGRTATIKGYGDAHDKALLEMQKLVLAKMPEDEVLAQV